MKTNKAGIERSFQRRLSSTNLDYVREYIDIVPWRERLLGIRGARGVGKTTLIMQKILRDIPNKSEALYVSLDNLYFFENNLYDLAEDFIANGGKCLFVDEVHKYANWSVELKMIYDEFPELKVVFTGSSILQMLKGNADLSRRALIYDLPGLSFAEYLHFEQVTDFAPIKLDDIVTNHLEIAESLRTIKPVKHFKNYLKHGYYPFYKEYADTYHQRLSQVINMVIDTDLVAIYDINIETVHKLKQLLYVIAASVPFKPNVTKLSQHIRASRNTTLMLFEYLKEARLAQLLHIPGKGHNYLRKPEKVFLGNTNLAYAIAAENNNEGNLRETFFLESISRTHQAHAPKKGDFLVDEHYVFEVGGKHKKITQIEGIPHSYVVSDNIEQGHGRNIPLWMFGLLKSL